MVPGPFWAVPPTNPISTDRSEGPNGFRLILLKHQPVALNETHLALRAAGFSRLPGRVLRFVPGGASISRAGSRWPKATALAQVNLSDNGNKLLQARAATMPLIQGGPPEWIWERQSVDRPGPGRQAECEQGVFVRRRPAAVYQEWARQPLGEVTAVEEVTWSPRCYAETANVGH
jgi:hypothetical protein